MTTDLNHSSETSQQTICVVLVSQGDTALPDASLLKDVLPAQGQNLSELRRLGPDALEFTVRGQNLSEAQLRDHLLEALGEGIDVCVMSSKARRKKLLICDMDSTVIGQECIDELADYAGLKEQISEITQRAMQGELDFNSALTERVGLLKGLSLSALQSCFEDRITLTPGARTLTATMRSHGAKCLLVSGGFTFFTQRVAAVAGFDENYANTLLQTDTELTGEVGLPILGRQAKLDRLNEAAEKLSIDAFDVLAIGDGANDMSMIEAAGLGIGFRPHPVLAAASDAVITGNTLETALYFQGIPREEWVTG